VAVNITPGDMVHWKWGNAVLEGEVKEVIDSRAEIISKGKLIVRNGTPENPAVVIIYKGATEVLKLTSELL
jgi:hypothetical protein